MANPLLDRALPEHLAEQRQTIERVEKLSSLERLEAIVEADLSALPEGKIPPGWRDSPVTIRFAFGFADVGERLPQLSGTVAARIVAVCQRCLEPCEIRLQQSLKLLLVENGSAATEGAGYEAWELDDTLLRPLDVVEETLIMALPMSPMHASIEACGPLIEHIGSKPAATDTVRPFADLKSRIDGTD